MKTQLRAKTILILLFLVLPPICLAQHSYKLRGHIEDKTTGSPLPGANILIKKAKTGTAADEKGNFHFLIPAGEIEIQVSFLGYHTFVKKIHLKKNTNLIIQLIPNSLNQEEITVRAKKEDHNLSSLETGTQQLKAKEIEALPSFMGNSDPIKALQYTPGIQSVSEGNAGIYVRGGTPGQNLILLDQMPLHNPSHLLGIFSVFNSLSLQDVKVTKGGIPAQYGGKLSSVIQVNTPASSEKNLNLAGNIGTLSTSAMLSGKTKNSKGFFILSARRTHLDLIKDLVIEPLSKNSSRFFRETNYYFNDFYAKFTYRISPKDRLRLQYFYGSDHYKYFNEPLTNRMNWKNWAAGLVWNHKINSNFTYSNSLSFSSHSMQMNSFFQEYEFLLGSILETISYKLDFYKKSTEHSIRYGSEIVYNSSIPEKMRTIMPDYLFQDQNKLH